VLKNGKPYNAQKPKSELQFVRNNVWYFNLDQDAGTATAVLASGETPIALLIWPFDHVSFSAGFVCTNLNKMVGCSRCHCVSELLTRVCVVGQTHRDQEAVVQ
jgi:hypothetical protein